MTTTRPMHTVRPSTKPGTCRPMHENQRNSFRIEQTFDAEVFYEGRVGECEVENLSAGGARVETPLEMSPGSHCTLGLRLDPELESATGLSYLSFHMQVLEASPLPGAMNAYRLRNATAPGSEDWENATRVVFAAQRRALAQASGADAASTMASDRKRRRSLRSSLRSRFGKSSLRPDQDD